MRLSALLCLAPCLRLVTAATPPGFQPADSHDLVVAFGQTLIVNGTNIPRNRKSPPRYCPPFQPSTLSLQPLTSESRTRHRKPTHSRHRRAAPSRTLHPNDRRPRHPAHPARDPERHGPAERDAAAALPVSEPVFRQLHLHHRLHYVL
jgi:hypothetical protein